MLNIRKVMRLLVTVTVMLVANAAVHPVFAAVDQREMRAREAFAVGNYQEALDLFAKLYAEKVHPNYLRNIGRCYQNLGDPDKAISSFTDYLRKAKPLTSDERAEVEGYIKEMEDLKAKRQAGSAPNPAAGGGTLSGTQTGTQVNPVVAAPPLMPVANTTTQSQGTHAPGADLTAVPGSGESTDGDQPVYQRWWFWALIGGAAALGIGVAAATGAFTKTEDAVCPAGGNIRC